MEGYQIREGQLRVTEAVERVLDRGGVLLCEAGTGIGKTFAYLVPALLSGQKVVISTATKTLQDQIAYRDLPLVQSVLGTAAPVRVMKGLSNYLCKRRFREFFLSTEAARPGYAEVLALLRDFNEKSEVGEFSELATLSESAGVRPYVASSSETRVGTNCPYFDECFVTQMKRDAEAAQIVIVNHHLFFADLALRGPHPGRVIPEYDAAIIDEAHQIEDTAALFFGVRLTELMVSRTISEAGRLFSRTSQLGGPLDRGSESPTVAAALKSTELLFSFLHEGKNGRRVLSLAEHAGRFQDLSEQLRARLSDLHAAARSRADQTDDDLSLREGLLNVARRTETLREGLLRLTEKSDGQVIWTETQEGRVSVSSTPVDLSELLRQRLFETVPSVALLSATLCTSSPEGEHAFSFAKARLGLDEDASVEQLAVPSPFPFEQHCVLYLPKDLPRPGTEEFLDHAAARTKELIDLAPGGVFVLTTSLGAMRGMHRRLKELVSARLLLLQGERPKDALLSAFRANGAAVLVATASFWEGVDVPGAALSLVVLEKIPFQVPTDPVFQARGQSLEAQGKSAFAHLALPGAALSLKQGFGRLIRREDDVGIVALLDERVHTQGYGKRLLAALPPARRTSDLEELRAWTSVWRASPVR